MRSRLSEWQLQQAESSDLSGVENFLEQLVAIDGANQRDQEASYFAQREDQPLCGYDLAETANRRRAIIREYQLSYAKIHRGMQFAVNHGVSFEMAKTFMSSSSRTWFLQVAPVLMNKNIISTDMYYRISMAVVGVRFTRAECDKLTASLIRKAGLFKEEPSDNDTKLVVQYRGRAVNFK